MEEAGFACGIVRFQKPAARSVLEKVTRRRPATHTTAQWMESISPGSPGAHVQLHVGTRHRVVSALVPFPCMVDKSAVDKTPQRLGDVMISAAQPGQIGTAGHRVPIHVVWKKAIEVQKNASETATKERCSLMNA